MHDRWSKHVIELENGSVILEIPDDQQFNACRWDTIRHNNATYELHVILRGTCVVDINDRSYLLEKQALLIAPGVFHSSKVISQGFERFTIGFTISDAQGSIISTFKNAVPQHYVFLLSEELESICRIILRECSSKQRFHLEMMQAQLTQLLIVLLRVLSLNQERERRAGQSVEKVRTTTMDNYFEIHYMDQNGKKALAQELNLSERQLSRELQEHYGMSYREKIISFRMDYAAWMLRTTDKRIGEIAGHVGYLSETAFYRAFRCYFRMSPRQYRQQFQKSKLDASE